MDLLPWIADERRSVARLIEGLSPQQLATASLCEGWTVQDVAAHLLVPLVTPMPRFALAMVRSGFDFDRANRRMTAVVARRPVEEIVAGLRSHAEHPFAPPGMSHAAPLTDLLVHQQDIRRPLGLRAELVPERLQVCLGFAYAAVDRPGRKAPVPAAARAGAFTGLRWEATDLDWSRGDGPVVNGAGEALLMMLMGRVSAVEDLSGDGAAVLRERLGRF
ncbi:MAG TPA: maleylpyruvate isomerase family mycothiol-dependent enzyme [Kineosporiaceae bacterium]|nr:maleylpyruvate isomerase family mycothiol-dependent enzyme [Kineosporiaceae bacterium]